MELLLFVIFAAFLLLFGSISQRIQTTVITAPMVFVLLGLLLGDSGLRVFAFDFTGETFTVLAELTLVLVLFADASRIDLRSLIREQDLPIRMLTVGLMLTIAAGTGVALLLFTGLSLWEAAILAVILTPTDAALAQAVISSRALPNRLRQALNVESGLNDGIAPPLLILFLVLSGHFTGHHKGSLALFAIEQLTLGPVVGVFVGFAGGKLLLLSYRRGWIEHSFLSLSAVALSWTVVVYALLSLTLIRIAPVAISLLGKKLMWESTAVLGWFGPRGVASIIYVLVVLREASLPGGETILAVTVTTIFLSVFLHGMTAVPLSNRYRRMMDRMMAEPPAGIEEMPEMKPVSELRTRKQM